MCPILHKIRVGEGFFENGKKHIFGFRARLLRNLRTSYRDVEPRKILLAASFDVKTIQKVNFH